VGAFCSVEGIIVARELPKTRSGKILRGTIKSIINGVDYKMPATIDNPQMLNYIKSLIEQWK
jgi:propionyl-CoA synthetase